MQLLNSQLNQLSDIPESLQISLQNIVTQVEIESHHYIKHPNFQQEPLPESVISRFQQLPLEIQNRHLILLLRNLLYSTYYNGASKSATTASEENSNLAANQNLENNSLFGIDVVFYNRLHSSNKGTGYWSHDWLVVKEETDGTLAVRRNGLTLHIERDIHLAPEQQAATVGNSVAIKMPKNLVQNAFYMAMSNASASPIRRKLARIYFNVTPDGAVAVMERLTTKLNAIPISFSFKALNNPSDYNRYDSAVLYFDKDNYKFVHPILESIYQENKSHFQDKIPLFTKLLAPGLGCAEEPEHRFSDLESFGTNRCQMIANGLLDAWLQGDNTPAGRIAAILHHFSVLSIKMSHPYLNANSEDIYTPLSL